MSKETQEQPIMDDKDLAEETFDKIYNQAIDHAIRIAEKIGMETNPINPPNVVAGLIIQELKKLKG